MTVKKLFAYGFLVSLLGGLLCLFALGAFGIIIDEEPEPLLIIGVFILLAGLLALAYGLVKSEIWRPTIYPATDRCLLPDEGILSTTAAWVIAALLGICFAVIWMETPFYKGNSHRELWAFLIALVFVGSFFALFAFYAGFNTLAQIRFGVTPLILISVPIRLGGRLEGFLAFPGLWSPMRITATLSYLNSDGSNVVAQQTFRPFSLSEMLRLVHKKAPEDVKEILPMLSWPHTRVPIFLDIPETVSTSELTTNTCSDDNDTPITSLRNSFWTLMVTARITGVNLKRTYRLPVQA